MNAPRTVAPPDLPEAVPGYVPYDVKRLSYASTFDDPLRARVIRGMEWATGKVRLLRLIRRFESEGVEHGQGFFDHAFRVMGIDLRTPADRIARIPARGPVIVVANHPHGLVDGMALANLIGRVRTDYRIMTRSLLTGIPEIERFMIPVPFAHEAEALRGNLAARDMARAQLAAGGVVALFPSGAVAAARTPFGAAEEGAWSPFTAKLIRSSGATVVPIRFTGQNSRAYQIANLVSATLRQGLLLHEVVHALDKAQAPVVGEPIPPSAWAERAGDPRAFMAWLRARTLAL
ncbi:lysophospholipid acyltransferase family protein [Jannaschia sp. Os4]|uniref:lysophospholipid acyltransferase family protein n=1 Tax=Jannaschia sp. Os4 TaxID=2807617 RepID=UPI00193ACD80|nr:lysophospholipid acyltransferase family protein [Jannaschia sp. Os4]MBM2577182.1 lysophospholipid acyltransferase family protein [Jannaschia sp. Os4]